MSATATRRPAGDSGATRGDSPRVDVEAVRRAAGSVLDPEIRRSLADMGLLDDVEVGVDGAAVVRYHLTSPLCPSRFAIDIGREVRRRVLAVPGVTAAQVHICDHFLGAELERTVNDDSIPEDLR
jgi:metal-sulfur cluster biosynthetic enzyme